MAGLKAGLAEARAETDLRPRLEPPEVGAQTNRGPCPLRRCLANQAGRRSNLGDLLNAAGLRSGLRSGAPTGRNARRLGVLSSQSFA